VKVEYAETARRQIRKIARDYARERRSLGADFVLAVDDAGSKLLENPRIGARLAGVQRRILLGRFPYLLVYEIDARHDRILVNCISHQRRHPDHWRGRVEDPVPAYAIADNPAGSSTGRKRRSGNQVWIDEIERRVAAQDKGDAELVPAADVFRRLEERLSK